jgi:hypothetical protein
MECCAFRLVRDLPTNLLPNANCTSSDVYYLAFPGDKRLHKWLVYSVYFLETVDTVFLTYDALADFRNGFGISVPASSPVQFSWLRMYIFGGIGMFTPYRLLFSFTSNGPPVTCMVQAYYASHLNFLRRSRIFTVAIILVDHIAFYSRVMR